jgi:hypothetical protein
MLRMQVAESVRKNGKRVDGVKDKLPEASVISNRTFTYDK